MTSRIIPGHAVNLFFRRLSAGGARLVHSPTVCGGVFMSDDAKCWFSRARMT